jgi:uncharacterized protein YwgA
MISIDERKWAAAAVASLDAAGSWTGRLHIHKVIVIPKLLGLVRPPFDFGLYIYGPYSFDLDRVIGEMELYGELNKYYRREGYGPSYRVGELIGDAELDGHDNSVIQRAANILASFDSKDLELIATCLWVERHEGQRLDNEIVRRVQTLKPKYNESEIRSRLQLARNVADRLCAETE